MEKKTFIMAVSEQIDEWAEDNGLAVSMIETFELAERIFNLLSQITTGTEERECLQF